MNNWMSLLPTELRERHIAASRIFESGPLNTEDFNAWTEESLRCADWLRSEGEFRASSLHIEASVKCLCHAIEVFQNLTMPTEYRAYLRRFFEHKRGTSLTILGELRGREQDLRDAADAFRKALSMDEELNDPLETAMTRNNLGNTLRILFELRGREQDLLDAVDAFREALEFHNEFKNPMDWAGTQSNLGNALTNLGQLRVEEEILQGAVDAYNAALRIYNKIDAPADWAMTQNNLGTALLRLGELGGRERDILSAIAAYRAVLSVRNETNEPAGWARSQSNLGSAFSRLSELRQSERELLASVRATFETLRVFDFNASTANWLGTLGNLSATLRQIGTVNEEAKAIRLDAKSQALSALPQFAEGAEPRHYLKTLKIALELGAGLGELGDDVTGYAASQMRLALQQAGDRDGRRHVLKEVNGLSDSLTCAALRAENTQSELPVFLDLTRARELGRRIEITERGMTPLEREDLDHLRTRMRDQKRTIEKARSEDREEKAEMIVAELRDLNRQIEDLFTAVETRLHMDPEQTAPLTLDAMQRNIGATGLSALLSVVSDDQGGFVLMIPAEGPIRVTPLPQTSHQDFDELVDDWLKTYKRCFSSLGTKGQIQAQAARDWEAHLQTSLPGLWARAGETMIEALSDAGLGPDSQVVLLLPGRLSLLPWEAALAPDGKSLRDHALISRIPSVRALATLAERRKLPDPASDQVLMVTDPRNDLKAVGITENPAECAFSTEQCAALTGDAATLEAVKDALPKANILSLFLHGNWGGAKADGSCLALAGDDLFFTADLDEGVLPDCHTVVIGACESGNTALEAPDEFDGLPSAFFSAGASSVIATLWPVLTIPTHETLSHLFQGLAKGKPAPRALRDALADCPSNQGASLQTNMIVLADEDASPMPEVLDRPLKYPLSTSAAFFAFGR